MAVVCAQPTDVVKVRLQAQAKCQGQAKRYSSTIHAYKTIAKDEGISGLWKGTSILKVISFQYHLVVRKHASHKQTFVFSVIPVAILSLWL